ncbi:hypothetical protein [Nocardia xishanensis]
MDTFGDWLELGGTLLTFYGLWFAWNRNSNRWLRRRIAGSAEYVVNRAKHFLALVFPSLRRSRGIVAVAAQASARAHNATASAQSAIDPGKPLTIQIQELAGQVMDMGDDLRAMRRRIEQVEAAGRSHAKSAERAAVQAVAELRDRSKIDAFTDLSIALSGIFVTAIGIVFGMIADGRFSWLPWG